MMKKWPLIILFFLTLSCNSADQLTFSEDKMIAILVDIHLAEASMQRLTNKIKDTLSVRYYNEIFEIHQVREEEYLENLEVLEKNPKLAKKIFDETMAKITAMENEQ